MRKLFLYILCFMYCPFVSAQGWAELGIGSSALKANKRIFSVCADGSGNIYAAGEFNDSFGKPYVAMWSDVARNWRPLGTGINRLNANSNIYAVCSDKNNNIYAAGTFTNSLWPSAGYRYVAKWNGVNWAELGTGVNSMNRPGVITSICADDSNNIYAAGTLSDTGGRVVMKWDASLGLWNVLGDFHVNNNIESICVDHSFNVYAGGSFTGATGKVYIAKWEHNTGLWSQLGASFDSGSSVGVLIKSIFSDSVNRIYAAANFQDSSGQVSGNVFKWDGGNWSQVGSLNGNSYIGSICKGDSGFVYAGGWFTNSSGQEYVAQYNPATQAWSELGTGSQALNPHSPVFTYPRINSICTDKFGSVYAGGDFNDADSFCYVARYKVSYLGLGEVPEPAGGARVYPNPSHGELLITAGQGWNLIQCQYVLCDYAGRVVNSGNLDALGNAKIDVSLLPVGAYVLSVGGRSYKVVKQ